MFLEQDASREEREKRRVMIELEVWMKKNECDVCAINETGLNGNEYVEVSDEYKWIGTNRDWMRGKTE